MLEAFAFIIGAVFGSFFNVCIFRLPRGISLLKPRSFCPKCKSPIRPKDNIPLLSYLLLKGKCRYCGAPISPRYPLVEGLSGLLALFCISRFGLGPKAFLYYFFFSSLLVSSFIDLEHRIIPDVLTLGGLALGIIGSLLGLTLKPYQALLGLLVGGGGLFLIGFLYELLRKREGMGGGDVKLLAMIGAFTGPKGALFSMFFGSFLGACVGFLLMKLKRLEAQGAIPFGPFLSIGSFLYLLWGERIIAWYSSILK